MADPKRPKQKLVFVMEYAIEIEPHMSTNVEGVLEKMSEDGTGQIVKVEVRNG